MNHALKAIAIASITLALAACSESGQSSTSKSADQTPAATWLLAAAPAQARSVTEAKADAAESSAITLRGRIGGRMEPISNDSSAFVIADLALPYCGQSCESGCTTPWDYCCETAETIKANTATVLITDASGSPLDVDPIAAGLNPLDEVIVVGTVGPRPDASVLTVYASGVYKVAAN